MRYILSFIVLSIFSNFVQAQCNRQTDSLALIALYNSTNGDNWRIKWDTTQPMDTWVGIKLNENGCVTCIDLDGINNCSLDELSGNNLTGTLPDEIGDLSELEALLLSYNSLSGGIPKTIGNLKKLFFIQLNDNRLNQPLPEELGELSNLLRLDLQYNQINGSIPEKIGDLGRLTGLSISNNRLVGGIPKSIGKLINLKYLYLWENQLTGSIPVEIGELVDLEFLFLQNNNLSDTIPESLGSLVNLKELFLSENNLTGNIPKGIGKLINLEYLELYSNELTGAIPAEIGDLLNLKTLFLTENKLNGPIPKEIGTLFSLERFYGNLNKLSGELPSEIGDLRRLEELILTVNFLEGQIPSSLENLTRLRILDLSSNNFSDEIPTELGKLASLTELNLSNNAIKGEIPSSLENLSRLQSLLLAANELTGNLPIGLNNLNNLSDLRLQENFFTFESFRTLPSLNNPRISPQKFVFKDTTFYQSNNNVLEIDLEIDNSLSNNTYQWSKNSAQWNPAPINDINSNQLLFPDLQLEDVGVYTVSITNPDYPGLTLESLPINVRVCNKGADSLQLVMLYDSTSGRNWNESNNWLVVNQPIGNWEGITTDSFGCVNKIDLPNNNLNEALPTLDLNTLDTLILESNNLTGNIPNLNVPFIKYIDLSKNQLEGDIPDVVSTWQKLRVLNFSENRLGSNAVRGTIPPDIGDLCDLEELRLNNNMFEGELPVELTGLRNLQVGRVDFSNNMIDSLKERIIFFCPFGDTILTANPSFDRFLGICNITCSGNELDDLNAFPWIEDAFPWINGSVENPDCADADCVLSKVDMGFVEVRGIKVFYHRNICFTSLFPGFTSDELVSFYDCGGNLLETVLKGTNSYMTDFGAITQSEFDSLFFDVRWDCGLESMALITSVNEVQHTNGVTSDIGVIPLTTFPNPANDVIHFYQKEDMDLSKMRCTNLWGQEVQVKILEANNGISTLVLDQFSKGMYLLNIPGKGRGYLAKVVVY